MIRRPSPPRSAALLLPVLIAGAAAGAYAPGRLLCRFQDPRIAEASGLAPSARSDDYFFTLNDSGDSARLFAVSRRGVTLAAFAVPGAQNLDWEDLSPGPGPDGGPALYIGDIGDNTRSRASVTVYRVPEPGLFAARRGEPARTAVAEKLVLRYPDGPRDCESLFVHPRSGRVFLVSKGLTGSGVYATDAAPRPGAVTPLRRVASIRFALLPASPRLKRDQALRLLATGAALSPDGSRVAVRTYTDAYEWRVPGDNVAAAFAAKPLHIPLPPAKQGEAIAYSRAGGSILVTSEGEGAPVHELLAAPP